MSLSDTDIAAIQKTVIDTVQVMLRENAALNGKLAYSELHAASLIGCPKHRLRDCRLRGEIKGYRIGRSVHYTRDELLRFLSDREIQ